MTTTKVPCSRCGKMILPATAERTGGVCMPCASPLASVVASTRPIREDAAHLQNQNRRGRYFIHQRGSWDQFTGYVGPNGPTYDLDEAFSFPTRAAAEEAVREVERALGQNTSISLRIDDLGSN